MGLFSFLTPVKGADNKSKFKANIDGLGVDTSSTGYKANIDGINLDSKRANVTANIDGLSINNKGKGIKANIDGISYDSNRDRNKFSGYVDGVSVQVTVDNIISKHAIRKLKELFGIVSTKTAKQFFTNLNKIYEMLREDFMYDAEDYVDALGQPFSEKKYKAAFVRFVKRWEQTKDTVTQFIYRHFTPNDKDIMQRDLAVDLRLKGYEILAGEMIAKTLAELRIKFADDVDLENKLSRNIKGAEDLFKNIDKFSDIYGDKFRNIAQNLIDNSKGFDQLSRTEQKQVINKFRDRMRSELRKTVLGGFIFGAGGLQRLTSGQLNGMTKVLSEQFNYLDGFISDLYAMAEQGKEINPNIVERAGSYSNVMRQAYFTAYQQKAVETYGSAFYEKRTLRSSKSCPDCIDYAGTCQPNGTLPLPTVDCVCQNNCLCEYQVFDSEDACNQSQESFNSDSEE